MKSILKALFVITAALVHVAMPPVPSVAAFKYLQEGMTAPAVEGRDLITGAKVSSSEKMGSERQTTCIAFWATWSPRSIELLSDLKEMSKRLSDQPFRVIAVNVDSQVTTAAIKQRVQTAVEKLDPPFPVIVDDDLRLFYEYGVIAVPSVAILDVEHIVIDEPSGYSYAVRDRLVDNIEAALGLRAAEATPVLTERYRPDPRASRYYNLALQLANQHHYESALERLNKATEIDSAFSAPFNLRGHIQLELGNVDDALASFRHAIELDNSSVAAHAGLGHALLQVNDTTAALEQIERALELEPAYPAALLDLGRCLAARHEYDRAIDVIDQAIDLNPRDFRLHYHLGCIYREYDKPTKALEEFRAALEMVFPRP